MRSVMKWVHEWVTNHHEELEDHFSRTAMKNLQQHTDKMQAMDDWDKTELLRSKIIMNSFFDSLIKSGEDTIMAICITLIWMPNEISNKKGKLLIMDLDLKTINPIWYGGGGWNPPPLEVFPPLCQNVWH